MILQDCLDEIEKYESNKSNLTINDFKIMLGQLAQELSGAYKVRFSKLVFFKKDNDFSNDDIPF